MYFVLLFLGVKVNLYEFVIILVTATIIHKVYLAILFDTLQRKHLHRRTIIILLLI